MGRSKREHKDVPAVPQFRRRSKSAPRGRSPAPKELKKAKAKVEAGYVTPSPRRRDESSGSRSSCRRISFSATDTVTPIVAENASGKNMSDEKATEILAALQAQCVSSVLGYQQVMYWVINELCWGETRLISHVDTSLDVLCGTLDRSTTLQSPVRRPRQSVMMPRHTCFTIFIGKGLSVQGSSPKLLE